MNTLETQSPLTVFAPTNDAFAALPAGVLANLLKPENKAQLVDILTYHVVSGNVSSSELKNAELVPTLEGKDISVNIESTGFYLNVGTNGAEVIKANVEASNGVVHLINAVLLPPPAPSTLNIVQLAQSVPDLSTLVQAVVAGGLASTLSGPGPFTVLAPTNEAFAGESCTSTHPDIVFCSRHNPLLSCTRRWLVFLTPRSLSCALHAALPAGVLANLLKPENKALLDSVLTYHVVSGEVYSYQIDNGASVPSLDNGAKLAFQVNNGQIYVEETATVINANLQTSNGVVHVISAVLIPPSVQLLLSSM